MWDELDRIFEKARYAAHTSGDAGALYRQGKSACVIAQEWSMTRKGVEKLLRREGLGGNVWCKIHREYELLVVSNENIKGMKR